MRGATECARRLKLLFSNLRARLGKVSHPPITDPITQLILGVLSRDTPDAKASEGLERLRGMVVDYNELRVIPPIELAEVLSDFPDARLKCEDISRALNAIFAREHAVSLDRLVDLPRKEVIAALDKVDGPEAYTRARIRLLGLRQHAVPLDEAMWAAARAAAIVDQRCPLAEAQAFLERQIDPQDSLEFFALFKRHAWSEMGAAVKKRTVQRILSVPPDRTTRNMLQLIGRDPSADVLVDDELTDGTEPEMPPAPAPAAASGKGPGKSVAHTKARKGGATRPARRSTRAVPSERKDRSSRRSKSAGRASPK